MVSKALLDIMHNRLHSSKTATHYHLQCDLAIPQLRCRVCLYIPPHPLSLGGPYDYSK